MGRGRRPASATAVAVAGSWSAMSLAALPPQSRADPAASGTSRRRCCHPDGEAKLRPDTGRRWLRLGVLAQEHNQERIERTSSEPPQLLRTQ
jgi:hypothetical protein